MIERKIFNQKWKMEMLFLLVREEVGHHIKELIIIKYLKIIINNNINNQIINNNLNIFNSNRISNNLYNKCNINKVL